MSESSPPLFPWDFHMPSPSQSPSPPPTPPRPPSFPVSPLNASLFTEAQNHRFGWDCRSTASQDRVDYALETSNPKSPCLNTQNWFLTHMNMPNAGFLKPGVTQDLGLREASPAHCFHDDKSSWNLLGSDTHHFCSCFLAKINYLLMPTSKWVGSVVLLLPGESSSILVTSQ